MKIIINTFSPIKELIIASEAKTITSVKHKLICPTADNRSLSSFDSFIMFCIEVLIEVSYTFSKLSFNTLLNAIVYFLFTNKNILSFVAPNYKLSFISGNKSYKLYPNKLSK